MAQFACVAFDALYGRGGVLRLSLTEQNIVYCADVPSGTRLFTGKP